MESDAEGPEPESVQPMDIGAVETTAEPAADEPAADDAPGEASGEEEHVQASATRSEAAADGAELVTERAPGESGMAPRPRGRPKAGCKWDGCTGTYVPSDAARQPPPALVKPSSSCSWIGVGARDEPKAAAGPSAEDAATEASGEASVNARCALCGRWILNAGARAIHERACALRTEDERQALREGGPAEPGAAGLAEARAEALRAAAAEGLTLTPNPLIRSGFKGVQARAGQYQAQSGGTFRTAEEAALALARALAQQGAAETEESQGDAEEEDEQSAAKRRARRPTPRLDCTTSTQTNPPPTAPLLTPSTRTTASAPLLPSTQPSHLLLHPHLLSTPALHSYKRGLRRRRAAAQP